MGTLIAGASEITVSRPYTTWIFGGIGFQNSEANFLPLMSEELRDQYIYKSFAEISPTFSRTITGFADQSKAAMDRWVEFYDNTFRKADTTLYVYPLVMPANPDLLDRKEYAEKVARNLRYLIKDRKCTKIRYYGLTNELMAGLQGGRWFEHRMDLFKEYYIELWKAFKKYGLDDVQLLATDMGTAFPYDIPNQISWAYQNIGDFVGVYGAHWYYYGHPVEDLRNWDYLNHHMASFTAAARAGFKRFILGEYGYQPYFNMPHSEAMWDDTGYQLKRPDLATTGAILMAEIAMAALNQGVYAAAKWSFVDYPDPFYLEPSDDPREQARYESGLCGWNADRKYNKWGSFRWNDRERDYSAYPDYYVLGHLARLFRKGSSVLVCEQDDLAEIRKNLPKTATPIPCADPRVLRVSAVQNPDLSVSMAIVNHDADDREIKVKCPWFKKPVRRYDFVASRPPVNPFNDLQGVSEVIDVKDGEITLKMAHESIVFLTTDYEAVVPAPIEGVKVADGKLTWQPSASPNHRYYRVYKNGKQIASTVATSIKIDEKGDYAVTCVDKWLNEGAVK